MPNVYYEYDQVFIQPDFSDILSRSEVDTGVILSSRDSDFCEHGYSYRR
jgi:hypothetical protein